MNYSIIKSSFFGDLASTTAIFSFSFLANNSCVYDAYWPIAPIPIAAYWLSLNKNPSIAAYTGFGLLAAWAIRYLSIEVCSAHLTTDNFRRIHLQRSITRTGDMLIFVRKQGKLSG